jgi:hypothetical protein
MPGPPGRFELSIAERLSPVLHAIERRRARAQHRRMMTVLDHRGRTKEEAEIVQGPWAEVEKAYAASMASLRAALDHLREATRAVEGARRGWPRR